MVSEGRRREGRRGGGGRMAWLNGKENKGGGVECPKDDLAEV